ncbi:helix-turn-helix domain-containing protein [Candidatus Collierbacteria bacterium]|nr:helix-turn-helix domain-containing protein [Candidatus Collierbacteria bacterium]
MDGIYQKGNFKIVPYLVPGNYWTVYFPDLDYSREFWKEISKTQHNDFFKPFPKIAEEEILAKLKRINSSKELELKWKTREEKFWSLCRNFLDLTKVISKIGKIVILPTEFGTQGSYHPNIVKDGYDFAFSTRSDMGAENIARLILLSLYNVTFRDSSEIDEINWHKRQAVIEFLVKKTIFSRLFISTKNAKNDLHHIKDSKDYLAKLGFPLIKNRNYSALENILTTKEKLLFDLLRYPEGKLVSYDQIGDVLWPNQDDKFSLYAIAKLVEGLRKKLRSVGLDSSLIKTSKGLGYYLR